MSENNTPQPLPAPGISPTYFTIALVVAVLSFVAGGAVGFFIRPATATETVVVVTATPNPNAAAVAETAPTDVPPTTAPTNNEAPDIMDMVLADTRHLKGDPNAPVTIVEFSDFKCPYCAGFATETLTQIQENYIDSGKVRFAYKHMAVLSPESMTAALATECAAEQDQFWEMHDYLYNDQATNRSPLNNDSLVAMAAQAGLEPNAFSDCLEAGQHRNTVSQETLTAQSLGIRGTPAFLINGVYVSGAQPYANFVEIIESQLALQ